MGSSKCISGQKFEFEQTLATDTMDYNDEYSSRDENSVDGEDFTPSGALWQSGPAAQPLTVSSCDFLLCRPLSAQ